MAVELDRLLEEIPILSIKQKIETAEKDIRGLKVKGIQKGKINVNQEIKIAKGEVIGVEGDEIGDKGP